MLKPIIKRSTAKSVKAWRLNTKHRMVEAMGGCCQCCGYDKCESALDLHHIDPTEKGFAIGLVTANPKKWETIVKELRKCVMVCTNCHREIHAGVTKIPVDCSRFNEDFAGKPTRANSKLKVFDSCPVCGVDKPILLLTCSHKCARHRTRKVNWDNVDVLELKKTMSTQAIADMLGVSYSSIRKQLGCKGWRTTRVLPPANIV